MRSTIELHFIKNLLCKLDRINLGTWTLFDESVYLVISKPYKIPLHHSHVMEAFSSLTRGGKSMIEVAFAFAFVRVGGDAIWKYLT